MIYDSLTENIITELKVNTYFVIIEQLKSELHKRKIAHDNLLGKYIFFLH